MAQQKIKNEDPSTRQSLACAASALDPPRLKQSKCHDLAWSRTPDRHLVYDILKARFLPHNSTPAQNEIKSWLALSTGSICKKDHLGFHNYNFSFQTARLAQIAKSRSETNGKVPIRAQNRQIPFQSLLADYNNEGAPDHFRSCFL